MVEEINQQQIEPDNKSKESKDSIKTLRKTFKQRVDRVADRVKEQKRVLKAIRSQLENLPCTVPEVAAATAIPTDMVLWYIAAMKKYGQIAEQEKDDGYYRYSLQGEHHVSN
ncbi:MAG: winged helix-turn-helix domain-containing protein [Desulfamplus sp.]|nr:winged helix-turn-helix domain-containing protein [Desulfamplus sp.]MBF0210270.1 winged helix-turn-helix domain-containing protein [Desulfamplus sp.]MBF0243060.1 winged helix-turn-helix domain-containing protein [Desulfamplus sp.]